MSSAETNEQTWHLVAYLGRLFEADGHQDKAPDESAALVELVQGWADTPGESRALAPDEKKARVAYLLGGAAIDSETPPMTREQRAQALRRHLVGLAEADGWSKLEPRELEGLIATVLCDADEHGFEGLPTQRALQAADRNLGTLYYWHHEGTPTALGRGVRSLERYCRSYTFGQLKADPKRWARLGDLAMDISERVFDLAYDHAMRNIRGAVFKLQQCRQALEGLARGEAPDWDRLQVPWEFNGALDRRLGTPVHPADFLTRHYLHYRIRKRWFEKALREVTATRVPDDDVERMDREQDEQVLARPARPDSGVERREQERAEAAGRTWFLMDWGERSARSKGQTTWKQLAFAHWGLPQPETAETPTPKQNEPRHIECDTGARFRFGRGLRRTLWRLEQQGFSLSDEPSFEQAPMAAQSEALGRIQHVMPRAISQLEAPGKERYALRRVLQHLPDKGKPAMHLISIANVKVDTTEASSGQRRVLRLVEGARGAERQRRLLDLAAEAGLRAELLLEAQRAAQRSRSSSSAGPAALHTPARPSAPSRFGKAPPPCGHGHERDLWLAAGQGRVPGPMELDEMTMVLELCEDCRTWWREHCAAEEALGELEAAMVAGLQQAREDERDAEAWEEAEVEAGLWAEVLAGE